MAVLRVHLALLLTLWLGAAAAQAQGTAAAQSAGLFDRPVLVVDPGMHTAMIRRASADRDGRWVVTGSDDKTVRVWSLADGALLRTIRMPAGPGDVGKVYAVAMSPDGALIAVGGWTGPDPGPMSIYLFDRATGAMVRPPIDGLPNVVSHLTFSPDGTRVAATLGGGNGLRVYAAERGWNEVARDTAYGDSSWWVDFARDGRLATTSYDGKLRLYANGLVGDVQPAASRQLSVDDDPYGVAFNPDGTRLAVGYHNVAKVDLLDGHTLEPLKQPELAGVNNGDVGKVAWSRDGQILFAGGEYDVQGSSPVLAWTAAGTGPRRALRAGMNTVTNIIPMANGDLLVASADPWLARLTPDGTARWVHGPPNADFRNQYYRFYVSNDGTSVGFGFEDFGKSPARFDVAERKLILAPAADTRMAVPRQEGLPIEGWRNQEHPTLDGKPLPLEPHERSRSLAINPAADRFVLGTEWWLRAFDAHGTPLWRRAVPGAVWAVNITGDGRLVVAAYDDGTIRWHRMSDGAELLAFMPQPNRRDWVAWTPEGFYAATDGAKNVLRWHINHGWDKPADSVPLQNVPGYERPTLPPFVLQELETPRALGLAVMAEVKGAATIQLDSPPGPQLHLLAIGVRSYAGTGSTGLATLRYADRDADDFANKIVATQGSIYTVKPQVLLNDDANMKGIMAAFATMRGRMEKGGGNDLAVVFFSGHGDLIDGELYLLPDEVDARSPALIKATALSLDALKRELNALAINGRVLVLLDACHSGAATADGTPLVMDSTRLRTELAAANITVLTSSSGTEVSREDDGARHGFFAEVVLNALTDPTADINGNHLINAYGLANYVHTHVSALTGGAQTPDIVARFSSTLFADVGK
jgi:WD40 repeat protein